jgi:hypothetical protein
MNKPQNAKLPDQSVKGPGKRSNKVASQPESSRAGSGEDSMILIAAILGDSGLGPQIARILDRAHIPTLIEGSKSYGINVPVAEKDRAMAVLKAAAKKNKLAIDFAW